MQCPTHKKKLEVMEEVKDQYCLNCGRKAILQCRSCDFKLCSDCRICNLRHNMIKMVDLKIVKPEYSHNGYSCDSCFKSSTLDDDGIWHCNICNYGLCPQCGD